MRYETQKLVDAWKEHGSIIVGVDFDDTIFPLTPNDYITNRCSIVQDLLIALLDLDSIILCLYTVSDNQSIQYKRTLMDLWKISPHKINNSPVSLGNGDKPFFNILLDDKAGLNETIEILQEFLTYIE